MRAIRMGRLKCSIDTEDSRTISPKSRVDLIGICLFCRPRSPNEFGIINLQTGVFICIYRPDRTMLKTGFAGSIDKLFWGVGRGEGVQIRVDPRLSR